MSSGRTGIIAHLGYPTESFTAPMIYNPWFASRGINAVVVPMGVRAEDYGAFLRPLFRLSNVRGALVTMPHKVATVGLLDEAAVAVQAAGSCSAILRLPFRSHCPSGVSRCEIPTRNSVLREYRSSAAARHTR